MTKRRFESLTLPEHADPSTPDSGILEVFATTGHKLRTKDSTGVVRTLAEEDTYSHGVEEATRGTSGSLASTYDRSVILGTVAIGQKTSAVLYLFRILLPKDLPVTSIKAVSGTTAGASLTNQWFALFDSSRVKLAITADDTTAAWPASTAKTLAITGGPFVTTYTGWHYLGIMVKATTMPNWESVQSLPTTGSRNLAPLPAGSCDTGLTNPASCPSTASALGLISSIIYMEVV